MEAPAQEVRTRGADVAVLAAVAAATALLLWLGRGLTFFADEWSVIGDRPLGLETFLRPFNEHWLGVTTLVHRLMVETVGLGSYLPYLALLAGLHAVVVFEVYVIARRSTWPVIAAGIAVIVAFFGSGFENLLWAMQIGFVGAVAMGLAALLLLDGAPSHGRVVAAVGLLTVGVMTSGFGLFMLAAVGLDVLVDRRRWRLVPLLVIPVAVYGAWYLVLGRQGVATHGDPFTVANVAALPLFIFEGLADAVGSALGIGHDPGRIAAVVLLGVLAFRLVRGGPVPRRAVALVGAIVVQYALLGLVRAQLGTEATLYSRYSYLSGIFALLAFADLIGRPTMPASATRRRVLTAAVLLVFTLSMAWNVRLLFSGRELFAQRADMTRAMVALGMTRPLPEGIDPDISLVLVPSPTRLAAAIGSFGSPLDDPWADPDEVDVPATVSHEALRRATDPPAWLLAQPWLP